MFCRTLVLEGGGRSPHSASASRSSLTVSGAQAARTVERDALAGSGDPYHATPVRHVERAEHRDRDRGPSVARHYSGLERAGDQKLDRRRIRPSTAQDRTETTPRTSQDPASPVSKAQTRERNIHAGPLPSQPRHRPPRDRTTEQPSVAHVPLQRAPAGIALNGYRFDFLDSDHHINVVEADTDLVSTTNRTVNFNVQCDYADKNFDDRYQERRPGADHRGDGRVARI